VSRLRRIAVSLVIVGTAALLTGAAAPDYAAMRLQPYDAPKAAPAVALPGVDGKTWRLEDARGKVVLLFFWTSW
jgi:cytochrome oxidase Cu insertion factor (SCO1/SenC/PrrC family)